MRRTARLLLVVLPGLGAGAAIARDDAAAAWHAAQRAQAAHEALSDRYRAVWPTLDAAGKARFGAQERAWLNEGRQHEQRACVAQAGTPSEAVARSCEADVIERHLRALAAPRPVAQAG
jgi:hypothetical protein